MVLGKSSLALVESTVKLWRHSLVAPVDTVSRPRNRGCFLLLKVLIKQHPEENIWFCVVCSICWWNGYNQLNGACRRYQEGYGFNLRWVIRPNLDLGKSRFWDKLVHWSKNDFLQESIFKDWFRSNRSTQNDRNDHRMISGFRCKHRLDSVFTDEISIVEANLDFHFSL